MDITDIMLTKQQKSLKSKMCQDLSDSLAFPTVSKSGADVSAGDESAMDLAMDSVLS